MTESSHARGIIHIMFYCSSVERFSAVTYIALILSIERFMRSNKLGGLKWYWGVWCTHNSNQTWTVKPLFSRGIVKVKVFAIHAMKAYGWSRCVAPPCNFETRWRQVVSLTPRPLYPPGEVPALSIEQEFARDSEAVRTFWWREKCLASGGIWITDFPALASSLRCQAIRIAVFWSVI